MMFIYTLIEIYIANGSDPDHKLTETDNQQALVKIHTAKPVQNLNILIFLYSI